MMIIESWKSNGIRGTEMMKENYYVIRDKETHEYDCRDGELTEYIMEANWFNLYSEAKESLEHFDEPENFEIIRFSCEVKLEEVME